MVKTTQSDSSPDSRRKKVFDRGIKATGVKDPPFEVEIMNYKESNLIGWRRRDKNDPEGWVWLYGALTV
jgi:hypothetical protein